MEGDEKKDGLTNFIPQKLINSTGNIRKIKVAYFADKKIIK